MFQNEKENQIETCESPVRNQKEINDEPTRQPAINEDSEPELIELNDSNTDEELNNSNKEKEKNGEQVFEYRKLLEDVCSFSQKIMEYDKKDKEKAGPSTSQLKYTELRKESRRNKSKSIAEMLENSSDYSESNLSDNGIEKSSNNKNTHKQKHIPKLKKCLKRTPQKRWASTIFDDSDSSDSEFERNKHSRTSPKQKTTNSTKSPKSRCAKKTKDNTKGKQKKTNCNLDLTKIYLSSGAF